MAVESDGTDYIRRVDPSVNPAAAFSMGFSVIRLAGSGTVGVFALGNPSQDTPRGFNIVHRGGGWRFRWLEGVQIGSGTHANDTWFRLGVTFNPADSNRIRFGVNGTEVGSNVGDAIGALTTGDVLQFFAAATLADDATIMPGAVAGHIWIAGEVLTLSELDAVLQDLCGGLDTYGVAVDALHLFQAADVGADISTAGNTLTNSGTTAYTDPSWVPSTCSTGGTETPQSVGGSLGLSGGILKQLLRALTGGSTPAGALTRRGSRTLAGASTPSATLVRRTARALVGAISSAGTLVRRTAKPLAATTTASGALAKRGTRTLAGAVTLSGALAAIRAFLTSVAGAVVLTGTAAARVTRALAAAVAPSGTVTKRTGTTIVGGVGPIGALQKRHPQVLVGSIAPGGLVWRRQTKPVAGTLAPSAALATQLTVSADLLQLTFVTALGPALTIRYSSLSTVLTMTSFAPEQIPLGTDVVLQLRGVKVFNVGTGTRVPATGITITARIALTPTGDAIDGTLQVTLTERVAGEFHGTLQGSASAAHLRAYLGTLVYVVLRVGTDDYLGHFPVRVVDGVALGV